jgi:hypothetical protein
MGCLPFVGASSFHWLLSPYWVVPLLNREGITRWDWTSSTGALSGEGESIASQFQLEMPPHLLACWWSIVTLALIRIPAGNMASPVPSHIPRCTGQVPCWVIHDCKAWASC